MWTIIDSATGHTALIAGDYFDTEAEAREHLRAHQSYAAREIEKTAAIDNFPAEWVTSELARAEAYYGSLSVQPVDDEQQQIDANAALEQRARKAQQKLDRLELQIGTARMERLAAITALREQGVSAYRIAQVIGLSQMQVARILKQAIE